MPFPIGRTITDVRWMKQCEVQAQGWWYVAPTVPVLVLDDGSTIWPAHDDQGDAGGVLFTRVGASQFIVTPTK